MGDMISAAADRLMAAQDAATTLPPITAGSPGFTVEDGYRVLAEIEARRRAQGWQAVGRKIGFTNRTIWPRYGVYQPMWAHLWTHSVQWADHGRSSIALRSFVQPRIEPEVVFKLKAPVPLTDDPTALLAAAEWIAPGFEIVQSHFPDWKFAAPDCTADCGLHAALIVGTPVAITDANHAALAAALPDFHLTLKRGDTVADQGIGSNVLGSPLLALAHLARLLDKQPQFQPLAAGEIITTGTVTRAFPVAPGETWRTELHGIKLPPMTIRFT